MNTGKEPRIGCDTRGQAEDLASAAGKDPEFLERRDWNAEQRR